MSDLDEELSAALGGLRGGALDAQISAGLASLRQPTRAGSAFGRAAVTSLANNALALPEAFARAAMPQDRKPVTDTPLGRLDAAIPTPIDALGKLVRAATFGYVDPIAAADKIRASGQRALPSGDQAVAAGLSLTGGVPTPGGIADRYRAEMARGQQMREEHPIASGAGDVAGDVATMMLGKMPFQAAIANGEKVIAGMNTAKNLNPGMWRLINEAVSSAPMKSLYRGLYRAGEAGLEGMSMAVLKGGDPLSVGAFSAGGQMAGSAMLSLNNKLWGSGLGSFGARVASVALAGMAVTKLAYEYTPLGQGNIFDVLQAADSSFNHISHALALGVGAGLLGAGRMRTSGVYEDIPKLIEGLTVVPRSAVMSVATDVIKSLKEGKQDAARALSHLVSDPSAFNTSQLKQLGAGLESGKFGATVDRLLKTDPRFVDTIDSDPATIQKKREEEERRQKLQDRLSRY